MTINPDVIFAGALGIIIGAALQRPKKERLDDRALRAELGEETWTPPHQRIPVMGDAPACFPPLAKPNPAAYNTIP